MPFSFTASLVAWTLAFLLAEAAEGEAPCRSRGPSGGALGVREQSARSLGCQAAAAGRPILEVSERKDRLFDFFFSSSSWCAPLSQTYVLH